ncbi:hypothetical protein HYFRA_00008297, partial [Hymenoscyphus fraxineus]
TPLDAPQISALGTNTFTKTFSYSLPPSDLTTYLTTTYNIPTITLTLTNPLITTLVAHPISSPDTIIGFVQLTEGTTEPCLAGIENLIELQRLYVDEGWHGRGVGGRLMDAIEEVARQKGFKSLWLGVWEENGRAQGMYGRRGFEKVGDHGFVMGGVVQRDWIMVKEL